MALNNSESMDKNIWEKSSYYQKIKDTHLDEDIDNDASFSSFFELLQGMSKKSFLDVGCGEGWQIEQLSKKLGGLNSFTGIDVSSIGLDMARGKKINNATFINYDGGNFPFPDEFFDVVLSSFVFEHLSDPMATFNEMNRVVKTGGIIIITCPNFGSPLFRSPCNKINRLYLMVKRFIMELAPKKYFKNDFHWDRVTPISLPDDVHIPDYDTLCEPNLSSFEKFLTNHRDKYSIMKIDSLWGSYDYKKIFIGSSRNHLKEALVGLAKIIGVKKILRFQYFGSFFFVAIKKL